MAYPASLSRPVQTILGLTRLSNFGKAALGRQLVMAFRCPYEDATPADRLAAKITVGCDETLRVKYEDRWAPIDVRRLLHLKPEERAGAKTDAQTRQATLKTEILDVGRNLQTGPSLASACREAADDATATASPALLSRSDALERPLEIIRGRPVLRTVYCFSMTTPLQRSLNRFMERCCMTAFDRLNS